MRQDQPPRSLRRVPDNPPPPPPSPSPSITLAVVTYLRTNISAMATIDGEDLVVLELVDDKFTLGNFDTRKSFGGERKWSYCVK